MPSAMSTKEKETGIEWDTQLSLCAYDIKVLGENTSLREALSRIKLKNVIRCS
jgi:hypothetical protein